MARRNRAAFRPTPEPLAASGPPAPTCPDTAGWLRGVLQELLPAVAHMSDGDRALLERQLRDYQALEPLKQASDRVVQVRERSALDRLARELSGADVVACDLETSGLDPRRGEIVGVGLAHDGGAYYIPTGHRLEGSGELLPDQFPVVEAVRAVGLDRLRLAAHNAKFEMLWLRMHAGVEIALVWDTMLAARLLRSDLSADLEEVAMRELDVPAWALPKADMKRMQFLPIDLVADYCGKDVLFTLQLVRRQQACLTPP